MKGTKQGRLTPVSKKQRNSSRAAMCRKKRATDEYRLDKALEAAKFARSKFDSVQKIADQVKQNSTKTSTGLKRTSTNKKV